MQREREREREREHKKNQTQANVGLTRKGTANRKAPRDNIQHLKGNENRGFFVLPLPSVILSLDPSLRPPPSQEPASVVYCCRHHRLHHYHHHIIFIIIIIIA